MRHDEHRHEKRDRAFQAGAEDAQVHLAVEGVERGLRDDQAGRHHGLEADPVAGRVERIRQHPGEQRLERELDVAGIRPRVGHQNTPQQALPCSWPRLRRRRPLVGEHAQGAPHGGHWPFNARRCGWALIKRERRVAGDAFIQPPARLPNRVEQRAIQILLSVALQAHRLFAQRDYRRGRLPMPRAFVLRGLVAHPREAQQQERSPTRRAMTMFACVA